MLHSNRSAAYSSQAKWAEALRDAVRCTELQPTWPKGFCRKGAAMVGMGQPVEGIKCFKAALAVDSTYEPARQAMQEAAAAIRAQQQG